MASYSYKRVMYRPDFEAAIEPAMVEYGSTRDEYDGDAGYDGDGWVVAAHLLEQKDAEIKRLRAALENVAAKADLAASAMDGDERGQNIAKAFGVISMFATAAKAKA